MKFTQAYAPAPICSASRASILTGKTTARVGLEFVVKAELGVQKIVPPQPLAAPPFKLELDLDQTTVAEHLQGAGYETAYFGKWHLNPHYGGRYLGWSPTHGPGQQGFGIATEDFGIHSYAKPSNSPAGRALFEAASKEKRFVKDSMTQHAVDFLKEDHTQPFFLMVSHFYVHTPVDAQYEWLVKKYDSLIAKNVTNRDERVRYAAFVETLDHYVGDLLNALGQTGLAEQTLVVFLSDNGGHPEFASNQPLRGSKWNLYEGGIRVPMLARWPGHITAGSVSQTPVVGYDLFPTFAAASQAPVKRQDLDGENLLPVFADPQLRMDRPIYWHFPYYHPEGTAFRKALPQIGIDDFAVSQTRPHSAVRQGDKKLLLFTEDDRAELYDLSEDLSEQNDLSARSPQETQALRQTLENYLDHVDARRAKRKER